jgi:hypothetical protein
MMLGMTQNKAPSSQKKKKKKHCIRQADVILKETTHVPAA